MFAANMPTVVMSVEELSRFVYLWREPCGVKECDVVERPQYFVALVVADELKREGIKRTCVIEFGVVKGQAAFSPYKWCIR